jgi:tRNA threonylcarbamoyladenosine biosynthesis protein TsaB
MSWLAFETTQQGFSIALGEGEHVIAACEEVQPHQQAEGLIPAVESVLREAGIWYGDLQGIVVSRGPGSFTGVRIALAAARGMALASHVPLIGVTNLACLASHASKELSPPDELLVMLDARRGQCFWQIFDAQACALTEAALSDIADIQEVIQNRAALRHAIGSGVALLSGEEALETRDEKAHSDAQMLLRWLAARGDHLEPHQEVVPLYIRPPDAKKPAPFSEKIQQEGSS